MARGAAPDGNPGTIAEINESEPESARDPGGVAEAVTVPREHEADRRAPAARPRAHPRERWLTWLRRTVTVVVLAFVVVAALTHRKDLDQAIGELDDLSWGWLAVAIGFEAASLIAFARLQRWLLRAGGVHLRLREMVEITLAGNALAMSLPGGAAWAAAWDYAQLHRRGAKREVAAWVVLVAGALSAFALFLLMVVGSLVAGDEGPVASLRPVGLGLLAIPVVAALVAFAAHRRQGVRDALASISAWVARLPGGRRVRDAVAALVDKIAIVKPSFSTWLEALAFALLNWLETCACLAVCIIAVHGQVPWRGLLVAYTVGQVAASLPITPGGVGVVEGSITGLLVAYGMSTKTALAAVLLFRVVSFWALVPLGWIAWGTLTLVGRRRPGRVQHPWRVHAHEGDGATAIGAPTQSVGATKPLADRVFPPPPCEGCEDEPSPRRRRRSA